MRKQIFAVMVGLTVILGGCSKQSAQNTESTGSKQSIENIENILQEVKKDTKEIKSGKVHIMLSISSDNTATAYGYEMSGDEKFDPLELAMKGKIITPSKNTEVEDYIKDGVYYIKTKLNNGSAWFKKKGPTDNKHVLSFKTESINMQEGTLNLLDNKDNWDISKDGDKVTFKLKKTDELKNKVKEIHNKELKKDLKYSEFEYTVEYVYNTKNKKLDKLFYEIVAATSSSPLRVTTRGTLEDLNKEIKIELPEESKEAKELKEKKE